MLQLDPALLECQRRFSGDGVPLHGSASDPYTSDPGRRRWASELSSGGAASSCRPGCAMCN